VLVTNLADGWNSLCRLLAREHGRFQLQVKSTRLPVEWAQHFIQVWNGGEEIRLVRAMRDSDGWEFFQKGEPQDFEEKDLYARRIIRQRLDREAISRYLGRIGWDIAEQSFWESDTDATYFGETSKRPIP
jgi:hypothetical protein